MTLEYSNLPCLDQDVLRYVLISIFDVGSYCKMHLKSLMLMLHPVPTSGGLTKFSRISGLAIHISVLRNLASWHFQLISRHSAVRTYSQFVGEVSPVAQGVQKKRNARKIGQPISLPFFKTHKVVDTPGFERNKPYADCGP